MKTNLPYLDVGDSCAVNGTGPAGGCLVDNDITLGTTLLDVELELLFILKEGVVFAGGDLMRLKEINT